MLMGFTRKGRFHEDKSSLVRFAFVTAIMYCIKALSSHVRGATVRSPPSKNPRWPP